MAPLHGDDSSTLVEAKSVGKTQSQIIRQNCKHRFKLIGEKEGEGGVFYCPYCGTVRTVHHPNPTLAIDAES